MNKIFLDDEFENTFGKRNSLSDLASVIKDSIQRDDVIFCCVNLVFNKSKRTDQTGIELLIWLRLKGVKNHCILYSFETVHALLNRQPRYLMAISKGTSFVQIPVDLNGIILTELIKNRAEDPNLRICLKPFFNIDEFRHREANWWGVKQLWDAFNIVNNTDEPYPMSILLKFNELNNEVAKFLYEYDSNGIQKAMSKQIGEKYSQANETKRIEIIKLKDDQLKKENICKNFSYGKHRDDDVVSRLKDEISFIKNKIIELDEDILRSENGISIEKEYITNMISELHNKTPRILYIDDNISNGWEDVVNMILSTKIIPFNPDRKYKDNLTKLYNGEKENEINAIKGIINLNNPTLILLDLRLFDEEGANIDINNLSGNILLKLIKKDFEEIPVLITTASNKLISYNELIKSGAEAFWTKEGLDEHKTSYQTVENYLRLIFLIKNLHEKEYQYLRKLILILKNINEESWWCNHQWINCDKTICKLKDVKVILKQCISLYRSFLHKYHLGYTLSEEVEIMFFLTGLINKFGIIVELIHGIKNDNDYKNLNSIISTSRFDMVGCDIREKRNKSSHVSSIILTKETFFESVDLLEKYLLSPLKYVESIISNPIISIDKDKIKILDFSGKIIFFISPPAKGKTNNVSRFNDECALFATVLNRKQIKIKHSNDNKYGFLLNQISNRSKIEYNTDNQNTHSMKGEMGLLIGNIFLLDNAYYKVTAGLKKELICYPSKSIRVNYYQSVWDIKRTTNLS